VIPHNPFRRDLVALARVLVLEEGAFEFLAVDEGLGGRLMRQRVSVRDLLDVGIRVLEVVVARQIQFPFVLRQAEDRRRLGRLSEGDETLHLFLLRRLQLVLQPNTYNNILRSSCTMTVSHD
jgi:hypothetical protein